MGLEEYLQQQSTYTVDVVEQERKQTIDDYKSLVEQFYDLVYYWLKPFIDKGKIEISKSEIDITEKKLGTYQIQTLQISFSNKLVELKPKGTIMVGTDARIDVVYLGLGREMIVRAPKKMTSTLQMINTNVEGEKTKKSKSYGEMEWKLVETSNRMQLRSLNKDTFEQMLVSIVTNG